MNEFKLHQLRERRLVDFPKFQVIEGWRVGPYYKYVIMIASNFLL